MTFKFSMNVFTLAEGMEEESRLRFTRWTNPWWVETEGTVRVETTQLASVFACSSLLWAAREKCRDILLKLF